MKRKPNLLLIVMDSVRASNLSCYGYERNTTPNIDKIASRGIVFEQAISEGCWTLPVHTSLFTGLFPYNHGVTVSKAALPDNAPTLAYRLKKAGYQTACFTNNAYIGEASGLSRGFEDMEDVWRIVNPRGTERTPMSKLLVRLRQMGLFGRLLIPATRLVRLTRRILRRRQRKRDSGAQLTNELIMSWFDESYDESKPFFMFVNYMEVHEKYSPPHPYDRKFMPSKYSQWRIRRLNPDKRKLLQSSKKKKREDLEIMRALYDGELSYLDHRIGELMDFLQSRGVKDDTVVVITSDHGDSLGEHGELGHRTALYEQLIHVPLVIRYPDKFKPGRRYTELVQLGDLHPTFLELAGIRKTKKQSNGFMSLCHIEDLQEREYTVSQNTAPKSLNGMESVALRTDRYKFIWNSDGRHELYDLEKDRAEARNLYESKKGVAEKLETLLAEWKCMHKEDRLDASEAIQDEAIEKRLRALGYMN